MKIAKTLCAALLATFSFACAEMEEGEYIESEDYQLSTVDPTRTPNDPASDMVFDDPMEGCTPNPDCPSKCYFEQCPTGGTGPGMGHCKSARDGAPRGSTNESTARIIGGAMPSESISPWGDCSSLIQ